LLPKRHAADPAGLVGDGISLAEDPLLSSMTNLANLNANLNADALPASCSSNGSLAAGSVYCPTVPPLGAVISQCIANDSVESIPLLAEQARLRASLERATAFILKCQKRLGGHFDSF
jgi:hypothetical protein